MRGRAKRWPGRCITRRVTSGTERWLRLVTCQSRVKETAGLNGGPETARSASARRALDLRLFPAQFVVLHFTAWRSSRTHQTVQAGRHRRRHEVQIVAIVTHQRTVRHSNKPDEVSQIRYERLNARGATQGRIPVVDSPIRLTPPMPSSKIAAEIWQGGRAQALGSCCWASPASPWFRTSLLLSSGTDSVTKAGTQAPALPAQSSLHPLLTRARHRRDTLLAVLCHPTLKGQQTVPDFISEAEESQLLAFLDSRRCAP